jgi:hypothetical protein
VTDRDAERRQARTEAAHWRTAAEQLGDLDAAAAPAAWASLERYLETAVRDRLTGLAASLVAEAAAVERMAGAGADPMAVHRRVLAVRRRYLQAETIVDFFGDAVAARTTPALGALLRGYDTLAADSMAATLGPLGLDAPPALVYVDKGLGASILRAGVRLWDQAHPSPAAAIKLTRHNLAFPTAMLHETGHQVAHLSGWTAELADVLEQTVQPGSGEVAGLWRSWAGEIAADLHAFAQAGWVPVVALANVVDGGTDEVFRIRPGDPHPFGWIRVMFNVALCRSWFGAGPWDEVVAAWVARHRPADADPTAAAVARASLAALPALVDACTRRPMQAFGGRSLAALLDPRRVSPDALGALERRAGASLLTSGYLSRRHPLLILALLAGRIVTDPSRAAEHTRALRDWVAGLGGPVATAPRTGAPDLAPPAPSTPFRVA